MTEGPTEMASETAGVVWPPPSHHRQRQIDRFLCCRQEQYETAIYRPFLKRNWAQARLLVRRMLEGEYEHGAPDRWGETNEVREWVTNAIRAGCGFLVGNEDVALPADGVLELEGPIPWESLIATYTNVKNDLIEAILDWTS